MAKSSVRRRSAIRTTEKASTRACSKLCPKTVFASSINNSNEFARDIINLDNSVSYNQLKISREKIINYCSEDKINKLYNSIFKTNQIF